MIRRVLAAAVCMLGATAAAEDRLSNALAADFSLADAVVPEEPASDDGFHVVPYVRAWWAEPHGNLFITRGGHPGSASRIDVEDDLSLDSEWILEPGVDVVLGRHRLGVAYVPLDFTGRTTLDAPIVFHGTTFPAGTPTRSEVKLPLWIVRYDYALVRESFGELRVGPQLDVWKLDSRVEDTSPGGASERRSFGSALPGLSLTGTATLGPFDLRATAAGAYRPSDRYILDFDGGLAVHPARGLALELGYRWLGADINETTNDGDLRFRGPFVALSFRF
jgi:hypothetical protein